MELYGTQRSPETKLTYSEHREYRSLLEKLQWLQLQSRPDLSYEVNRAAQRSSAPTVADARALNAISLKAQRSSETTLRYPRGVINVSSAQLVTYGDASFANMEGSKSQCGVIVFLTHEPRLKACRGRVCGQFLLNDRWFSHWGTKKYGRLCVAMNS